MPVYSIQRIDESAPVYNFQVAGGTYVANGVVVHNKPECYQYIQYCGECPPGP